MKGRARYKRPNQVLTKKQQSMSLFSYCYELLSYELLSYLTLS